MCSIINLCCSLLSVFSRLKRSCQPKWAPREWSFLAQHTNPPPREKRRQDDHLAPPLDQEPGIEAPRLSISKATTKSSPNTQTKGGVGGGHLAGDVVVSLCVICQLEVATRKFLEPHGHCDQHHDTTAQSLPNHSSIAQYPMALGHSQKQPPARSDERRRYKIEIEAKQQVQLAAWLGQCTLHTQLFDLYIIALRKLASALW